MCYLIRIKYASRAQGAGHGFKNIFPDYFEALTNRQYVHGIKSTNKSEIQILIQITILIVSNEKYKVLSYFLIFILLLVNQ